MSKRDWRKAQRPSPKQLVDRTYEHAARTRVLHGSGCWCGEPLWHDWPDKETGAPHSR